MKKYQQMGERKSPMAKLFVITEPKSTSFTVQDLWQGQPHTFSRRCQYKNIWYNNIKIHFKYDHLRKGFIFTMMWHKNFYLGTPMNRYEYIHLLLKLISEKTISQYVLRGIEKNGYIYADIRKIMYDLPQPGRIENDYHTNNLSPHK